MNRQKKQKLQDKETPTNLKELFDSIEEWMLTNEDLIY
jgi:hypothetical protein